MKKVMIVIAALVGFSGLTSSAAQQQTTKKPGIQEAIVRVIAIKDAQNKYIANIIDTTILATPAAQSNPFTIKNGTQQTKNVVTAYYKAAWNKYDSQQKINLRAQGQEKSMLKMVTAATGLTFDQVNERTKKYGSFVAGLGISLKVFLRIMSVEGLAAIFAGIPYLFFVELGIPSLTIAPIMLGTNWTANFTKKTLYYNKKYKDLKPLFDMCDQRLTNDWKTWNLDATVQRQWLGKAIWE